LAAGRQITADPALDLAACGAGWPNSALTFCTFVHDGRPGSLAGLARYGPATRPRFITTVHGLYSVSRYSAIMTRGERVIAVSATMRDYLQRHYPELPAERIQLIQRGVDPVEFPYGYRPIAEWLADWRRQYPQLQAMVRC
jgi:hypothetical protein